MKSGSLTVVGVGYQLARQTTPESLASIESADKLFYVVFDQAAETWLRGLNRTAESIRDSYGVGRNRRDTYNEMAARILEPVRKGRSVCAAFYGHPGVFVYPSHEAIRLARSEGFAARMLPGISAEDCLFADLGIDPGTNGCQTFEATDFLLRRRKFDSRSHLVLWQIGAIGIATYEKEELWNRDGLRVLAESLSETYPHNHPVVVYEAAFYAICDPIVQRVKLSELPDADVTTSSTLYIPPAAPSEADPAMLRRLGMTRPHA